MTKGRIVIVPTGCANVASVVAAFRRLGNNPEVAARAVDVLDADAVVLPGVGHFGPAVLQLRGSGFDAALVERVRRGGALLAICLGMQLLCESSDEAPGAAGLGIIPGRVSMFTETVRVPQMGWNRIEPVGAARLLEPASMYFANSFRLRDVPDGWSGAMCEHGGRFAAAIERGRLLACQFHPELSGAAGIALIRRWLERAMARAPETPERREASC